MTSSVVKQTVTGRHYPLTSIEEGGMASEMTMTSKEVDAGQADHLVHVIETAIDVQRRYQFFVWSQSSLQQLVPHQLAICGAWKRARKQVHLEAFNSIFVPAPVLATL